MARKSMRQPEDNMFSQVVCGSRHIYKSMLLGFKATAAFCFVLLKTPPLNHYVFLAVQNHRKNLCHGNVSNPRSFLFLFMTLKFSVVKSIRTVGFLRLGVQKI